MNIPQIFIDAIYRLPDIHRPLMITRFYYLLLSVNMKRQLFIFTIVIISKTPYTNYQQIF